ncbi:branched-chain amino acid ABC transporter permease [Effusibacillus lacus]|uniref:Branched-chain amino acid ABC transporter permease n=1 Tax=Effusibacillus lacus TaxID=1348429 RepID=A0A292YG89_9BACL|nr:branched-chain amino acid ABC transporter permease [Effusibacillus lacus]TCS73662.1 amino acid/amide ABC transporter membrane protein 1 (HAAT family) [Effusibacillus lacus]GAX89447.1 branched-chain amino acid ABC transporter permease [Effusibacillus lacus]
MDLHVNLFLNGISLGMLIFLIAAGLSLIFGFMGVLNFAHGAIFIWGAYSGWTVYGLTGSFALGLLAGTFIGVALGYLVERFFVQRFYGDHIAQILLTLGLMLVLTELLKVFWGPNIQNFEKPELLQGVVSILNQPFPVYKGFIIVVGLLIVFGVHWMLTRTKYGIIIRAGVQDPVMVQALGINVRKVFTMVFAFGAALASFGGVMYGPSFGSLFPELGLQNQLLAFIVIVIGGIGNFLGAFVGSLLVGLSQTFMGYYWPEAALAVNVALMVIVLMLKPEGLFGMRR